MSNSDQQRPVFTRQYARSLFKSAGLTYKEVTKEHLKTLRQLVNEEMAVGDSIYTAYECHSDWQYRNWRNREMAVLWCKSDRWPRREAISFNPDGFIGFCGWADERNCQPILRGFVRWVIAVSTDGIAMPGVMKETQS